MAKLKQRTIENIYTALRPRLQFTSGGGGGGTGTVPPHTHSAEQIVSTPAGDVAADDVQEALEELAEEKLARSGAQPMLGTLQMNSFDITGVDEITLTGTAVIHDPIRIDFKTGVETKIRFLDTIEFDLAGQHTTHIEGGLHWNPLEGIRRLVLDVSSGLQLVWGSVYVRVKNDQGAAIPAMRAVSQYSFDAAAGVISVQLTNRGSESLAHNFIGLTMEAIADGSYGWVCVEGELRGPDMTAFADGQTLYVASASGELTDIPPTFAASLSDCVHLLRVGYVISAANPGTFLVVPERNYHFNELQDVDFAHYGGPAHFDVPMWTEGNPPAEGSECDAWRPRPASFMPYVNVGANYSPDFKDVLILANAAGGAFAVTLPNPGITVGAEDNRGRRITIKKVDTSLFRVTINAVSGLLDGESAQELKRHGEVVEFQSDGSNWWVA
jgi:hypothetical protein